MTTSTVFTAADLKVILAACRELRGQKYADGVDRGLYWEAFVRVAWEAGLRQRELLNLTWEDLEGERLRVGQTKSGNEIERQLSLPTVASLKTIRHRGDHFIFSRGGRAVRAEWKALLTRAGIKPCSINSLRCSYLNGSQPR